MTLIYRLSSLSNEILNHLNLKSKWIAKMMDSQSQAVKLLRSEMNSTQKRKTIMNRHLLSQAKQQLNNLKVKKPLVGHLLMWKDKKLQTNLLTWRWTWMTAKRLILMKRKMKSMLKSIQLTSKQLRKSKQRSRSKPVLKCNHSNSKWKQKRRTKKMKKRKFQELIIRQCMQVWTFPKMSRRSLST